MTSLQKVHFAHWHPRPVINGTVIGKSAFIGTGTQDVSLFVESRLKTGGRTILLRRNIMESPELFAVSRAAFAAAVEDRFVPSFTPKGNSDRTLWHEIGHYLGVESARDGRDLDIALEQA